MAVDDRPVVIQHADGRRYVVKLRDYRHAAIDADGHTYQQLGFRIESWEGGEPYQAPVEAKETPKASK